MPEISRRTLLAAGAAAVLTPIGCGTKPTVAPATPAAPKPAPARPLIQPAKLTDADWKNALPHNYPEQIRGGKTDEGLARELELEVFAFEFRGGPIHWWFEVTEEGQNTLPADKPVAKSDNATAAEGRLVVSVGRGASERMKKVMQAAGKDAHPESISFQFVVQSSTGTGGGTSGTGHGGNPLWFGWPGGKVVKAVTNTIESAKPREAVAVLTLSCAEPAPADKTKPRNATLTLKAKLVPADAPPLEGK